MFVKQLNRNNKKRMKTNKREGVIRVSGTQTRRGIVEIRKICRAKRMHRTRAVQEG